MAQELTKLTANYYGGTNISEARDGDTEIYYRNNVDLFNGDDTLQKIWNWYKDKLFSRGIMFLVNGKWKTPSLNFKSIVDNRWKTFFAQSMRFMMIHGLLVWCKAKSASGVFYPEIPEDNSVLIQVVRDPETNKYIPMASWLTGRKEQLYIIENEMVFNTCGDSVTSIVNSLKPLLFAKYNILQDRILQGHHVAMPRLVASNGGKQAPLSKIGFGADYQNSLATEDERRDTAYDDAEEGDIRYAEQWYAADKRIENAGKMNIQGVVPPGVRTRKYLNTDAGYGKVIMPIGATASFTPTITGDINFIETYKLFESKMFSVAGIEGDPVDVEENLQTYFSKFNFILTDIFNNLHNPKSLGIESIQPTFEEDNKTRINGERINLNYAFTGDNTNEIKNVQIYLTKHVYSDVDLAVLARDQNIISKERFTMLFPQIILHENVKQQLENDIRIKTIAEESLLSNNTSTRQPAAKKIKTDD